MDIPAKAIKDNSDIFVDFFLSSFNGLVSKSTFLSILKQANITSVFKNGDRNLKDSYDQLVSYQTYLQYLSVVYLDKLATS